MGKLDLRQLKSMNAFELITKATKSTILSEKMKRQTTVSKEEEESERIRRRLKERLQGKASVAQEGKESEQDGLRVKLLQRMRQEEERKQQEPPLMKKKKIPVKKPAKPKPSTTPAANEEGSIMDRFEKVRKRLRNESSDEDSEEERKKTKGSQYEMMKR